MSTVVHPSYDLCTDWKRNRHGHHKGDHDHNQGYHDHHDSDKNDGDYKDKGKAGLLCTLVVSLRAPITAPIVVPIMIMMVTMIRKRPGVLCAGVVHPARSRVSEARRPKAVTCPHLPTCVMWKSTLSSTLWWSSMWWWSWWRRRQWWSFCWKLPRYYSFDFFTVVNSVWLLKGAGVITSWKFCCCCRKKVIFVGRRTYFCRAQMAENVSVVEGKMFL